MSVPLALQPNYLKKKAFILVSVLLLHGFVTLLYYYIKSQHGELNLPLVTVIVGNVCHPRKEKLGRHSNNKGAGFGKHYRSTTHAHNTHVSV